MNRNESKAVMKKDIEGAQDTKTRTEHAFNCGYFSRKAFIIPLNWFTFAMRGEIKIRNERRSFTTTGNRSEGCGKA